MTSLTPATMMYFPPCVEGGGFGLEAVFKKVQSILKTPVISKLPLLSEAREQGIRGLFCTRVLEGSGVRDQGIRGLWGTRVLEGSGVRGY